MNITAKRTPRLLCLCDSPTVHTGFGRVAQSLISRWKPHFDRIDIYAINHDGDTPLPDSPWAGPKIRLLRPRHPWYATESMQRFLNLILSGEYTHVWIMQDLFLLSPNGFPGAFRQVCQSQNVRSLLYYPVDGPLDPEWTDMLRAVDVPVAYTGYGSCKALQAALDRSGNQPPESDPHAASYAKLRPFDNGFLKQLEVSIPHGVEPHFCPPPSRRLELRKEMFGDWLQPDDFLMVNVNQNSRRKAVWSSLDVLARMVDSDRGCGVKLLVHCPPNFDGINLESIGRQLGLKYGEHWAHTGNTWTESNRPKWSDERIRDLYHAADLNMTTTLGEGWGLSITEALATGCPVAAPDHTACGWILDEMNEPTPFSERMLTDADSILLPLGDRVVVAESRVRRMVNAEEASVMIYDWVQTHRGHRVNLGADARQWLCWDRIAREWLELFGV